MSDTIASILDQSHQWLQDHLAKQYPSTCFPPQLDQQEALLQAQHVLDTAASSGDFAATKQAARTWCLAWRAALKAYVSPEGSRMAQESVAALQVPAVAPDKDTAFRHYHSAILDEEFVVCATEQEARSAETHDIVAYVESEIRLLGKLREKNSDSFPETLRWLHSVKKTWGGTLEPEAVAKELVAKKRKERKG